MKNREILLEILLFLRKEGVNNENVLMAIEKIPPHFFLYLLGLNINYKDMNFNEITILSKILQQTLALKSKIKNVLITDFKLGWFHIVSSLLAKRVYGLAGDEKKIVKLEKIFSYLKLSNIFIKKSSNFLDWKVVAPFDLIVSLKCINTTASDCLDLLAVDGFLFYTKKNNGKVRLIMCNKKREISKINIDEFLLSENKIL
mgnify:FL=1